MHVPAHPTRTMLERAAEPPLDVANAWNAAADCLPERTRRMQVVEPPHCLVGIALVAPLIQRPRMWSIRQPRAIARTVASCPAFSAPWSAQFLPGLVPKTLTRSWMTHFCGDAAASPASRQALTAASASATTEIRRIRCIRTNVTADPISDKGS